MERVVEIVSYVIRQYLTKSVGEFGSDQTIVAELFRLGYTQQEVETAISVLCLIPNHFESKVEVNNFVDIQEGYRVFSPLEKKKFSFSFQGEILRLMNSSLLTTDELEKVLSEALQIESNEVGLKELESILHKVINDEERLLMIFHYPSGNGPLLLLN
ncbi:MAG: DUF494 domain-containing protein [Firmicutes bacterium]|mgnify:CR=1 FL=1|nr:DUF494 domain-containing protein [Bacillota bacterium]